MKSGDALKEYISFPNNFKELFWDVNIDHLKLDEHRDFIIERVLNMGNGNELLWLWATYSESDIRMLIKKSRVLSKKTARCWQNYFGLREDQMRCFSTYSMSPGKFY